MIIGIRGRIDPGPEIWIDGTMHPVISAKHADGRTVIEVGAATWSPRIPIGREPPGPRGRNVVAAPDRTGRSGLRTAPCGCHFSLKGIRDTSRCREGHRENADAE